MGKEVSILTFLGLNSLLDIKKKEISLWLTGFYGLAGILVSLQEGRSLWGILTAFGIGISFLCLAMLTKGSVGMGDGLILIALGTMMDWNELLAVVLMGLLCCAGCSLFSLIILHRGRKEELPFIPFVLLGYVGGLFLW